MSRVEGFTNAARRTACLVICATVDRVTELIRFHHHSPDITSYKSTISSKEPFIIKMQFIKSILTFAALSVVASAVAVERNGKTTCFAPRQPQH
jgi:hypothetical protein